MALVPKDEVDHEADLEKMTADLANVIDYAASVGLHGLMILSPRCVGCGQLHDFKMVTDISEQMMPGAADELAGLLRFFADCAENNAPTMSHKPSAGRRH